MLVLGTPVFLEGHKEDERRLFEDTAAFSTQSGRGGTLSQCRQRWRADYRDGTAKGGSNIIQLALNNINKNLQHQPF